MVRFLTDHPVGVFMSLFALCIAGVFSMLYIPVSLLPSMDIPVITASASHPLYDAEEMEELITSPLRKSLQGLKGLDKINGVSTDGRSSVQLRLRPDSDPDIAIMEAQARIDKIRHKIPDGTRGPVLLGSAISDIPVFHLIISLSGRSGCKKFHQLSEYAANVIRGRIEQLSEVAGTELSGATSRVYKIDLDPALADLNGITPKVIEDYFSVNGSSRTFSLNEGNYTFLVDLISQDDHGYGSFDHLIKDFVASYSQAGLVGSEIKYRPENGICFFNGKRAVSIEVYQRAGTRVNALKQKVRDIMENIADENPEIEWSITLDRAEELKDSVNGLYTSMLFAILIAGMLLLALIRDPMNAVMLILVIPAALLVTILISMLLGLSINMVTLSGLVLCIGMMTDNSLIVSDNIHLHIAEKGSLKTGIISGTNEVIRPLLSSTLTTCVVFLPLFLLSGLAGELFIEQAIVVSIGIFVSFILGITVIPVMFNSFINKEIQAQPKEDPLLRLYERTEIYVLEHHRLFIFIFLVIGILPLFLLNNLKKKVIPAVAADEYCCALQWTDNIDIDTNYNRMKNILGSVSVPGVNLYAIVGKRNFHSEQRMADNEMSGLVYIHSGKRGSLERAVRKLDSILINSHPPVAYEIFPARNLLENVFGVQQEEIILKVPSSRVKAEGCIFTDISSLPVNNTYRLVSKSGHYRTDKLALLIDEEQLMAYNIKKEMLLEKISFLLSGAEMEVRSPDGRKKTLIVTGGNKDKFSVFSEAQVKNEEGRIVPVKEMVEIYNAHAPAKIESGKFGREVSFLIETEVPEEAIAYIRRSLNENQLQGYFDGGYFRGIAMGKELMISLLLALILLYFILAAQFESLLQPLIVLSELIIDLFCVFLLLLVTGHSLNLISGTGIMIMCGIVINDSILKVDMINRLMVQGHGLDQAVIRAGKRRFRPIVMTSLTTVMSMLPILFTGGMGSRLQHSFALALIAGMVAGTATSLYFIPLAYRIVYSRRRFKN